MARSTKVLSISVPERLAEELERMAAEEGVSRSEHFRSTVKAYKREQAQFRFLELQRKQARLEVRVLGARDLGVEDDIRRVATFFEPEAEFSVVDDEPDNRILECAVAARASAIVTEDRHLLALKSYQGIGIMTVSDLLYTFPDMP
jgi:PIN domain/Ribbon-helix-helix protein, copG family